MKTFCTRVPVLAQTRRPLFLLLVSRPRSRSPLVTEIRNHKHLEMSRILNQTPICLPAAQICVNAFDLPDKGGYLFFQSVSVNEGGKRKM